MNGKLSQSDREKVAAEIEQILRRVLDVLDQHNEKVPAAYVSQALDALQSLK